MDTKKPSDPTAPQSKPDQPRNSRPKAQAGINARIIPLRPAPPPPVGSKPNPSASRDKR
ncbi:hypothetical protein K470DRAFT_255294 [Piedraia hortae CBS 480.64]|uniref:Uncharacterized protein n=1 Tax=Piedraia hortae CBS 480.64 TaxID=1314780 RepID=A0A6A7C7E5_9PEZI|nr:hypothetical protein K470DRAFT_255294 [Piedraia hortae CBS 480.64]